MYRMEVIPAEEAREEGRYAVPIDEIGLQVEVAVNGEGEDEGSPEEEDDDDFINVPCTRF